MESNLSLEQQAQVLAQHLKLLESYLEEINNREGMSMKAIIENKASIEAAKTFSKTFEALKRAILFSKHIIY